MQAGPCRPRQAGGGGRAFGGHQTMMTGYFSHKKMPSRRGVEVLPAKSLRCAGEPRLDYQLVKIREAIRSRRTRTAGWPSKCGVVKPCS